MNRLIGYRLRAARENCGLSIDDVARILSERNVSVSPKTLYGYENGVSSPKVSVFMVLCDIYGIADVLAEFGYSPVPAPVLRLTPHEHELILAYRSKPEMQPAVDTLLGVSSATPETKNA